MAIPKAQLNLITRLMEVYYVNGEVMGQDVIYVPNDEIYIGFFPAQVVNKLQKLGVIKTLGEHDDGALAIQLVERDDFLSSFKAGVREARNGNDLHYADYSNNQWAFSCGYEHYHSRHGKKKVRPYRDDDQYVCHGFILEDTGEEWEQS